MQEWRAHNGALARTWRDVRRGALMWIFAITKFIRLHQVDCHHIWEIAIRFRIKPCADCAVIRCSARECSSGKFAAQRSRRRTIVIAQVGANTVVLIWICHDADMRKVFRCRANHARPTNINIFNRLFIRHAIAAYGRLEWIEIDTNQIDRSDSVFGHRGEMRCRVALTKQSTMNPRMQCLQSAVHHFGKARELFDGNHRDSLCSQSGCSAAG